MKVLRLTKLMQYIKWQGYKHESSPSTIFRLSKHQIVINKKPPNLITVKTLLVFAPDVINVIWRPAAAS